MSATARRLRVVTPAEAAPPKRWQGDDSVFFHRRQVTLGTRLVCMGRIDHGREFVVQAIRTIPTGRTRHVSVDVATRLGDEIVLRQIGGNWTRTLSFAALSYSAIWRLA